jgi:hypothetical protein
MCIKHMGLQLIGVANIIPYLGSLEPRLTFGGRKESLVHTVCACATITDSIIRRTPSLPRGRTRTDKVYKGKQWHTKHSKSVKLKYSIFPKDCCTEDFIALISL